MITLKNNTLELTNPAKYNLVTATKHIKMLSLREMLSKEYKVYGITIDDHWEDYPRIIREFFASDGGLFVTQSAEIIKLFAYALSDVTDDNYFSMYHVYLAIKQENNDTARILTTTSGKLYAIKKNAESLAYSVEMGHELR